MTCGIDSNRGNRLPVINLFHSHFSPPLLPREEDSCCCRRGCCGPALRAVGGSCVPAQALAFPVGAGTDQECVDWLPRGTGGSHFVFLCQKEGWVQCGCLNSTVRLSGTSHIVTSRSEMSMHSSVAVCLRLYLCVGVCVSFCVSSVCVPICP